MSGTRKSFRTPLGRVRALGSAHQGTQDALVIRATSLALVPLTVGFVLLVLSLLHKDYNGVRAELGQPLPAVLVSFSYWSAYITRRSACVRSSSTTSTATPANGR